MTGVLPAKMGATAPVEVGTRGTVGSLVKKEMEYFRGLELGQYGRNSGKSSKHFMDMASGGGNSWLGFGFLIGRRKKKRSSGFLPGICSVVEVADTHQLNGIPGFNYRNLKADAKEFEV